jgi:hypothetical protein
LLWVTSGRGDGDPDERLLGDLQKVMRFDPELAMISRYK